MNKMTTKDRREAIKKTIYESEKPISASVLASQYEVSRQIVVGDVALLRAANEPIVATPRGYVYQKEKAVNRYVIACCHNNEMTQEELNIIVDCGGIIENVIVSHPVYGELMGALHIHNRVEVRQFIEKCKETNAQNLSVISNGVHLHTIIAKDDSQYEMIQAELKKKGFIYEK